MAIPDDGDIIRACGFLAIYTGNLEDELDQLFAEAKSFCPELAKHEHLRFADKARHLRKALAKKFEAVPPYAEKAAEQPRVDAVLRHCKVVAEARNDILHSSIYSDQGKTLMKNRRKGTQPISSAEVYDLANEIFDMNGSVYGLSFSVRRLKLATEKSGSREIGNFRPV